MNKLESIAHPSVTTQSFRPLMFTFCYPAYSVYCYMYMGLIAYCMNKLHVYVLMGLMTCLLACSAISALVFATQIVQSPSTFVQTCKHLAFFCDFTGRFVSDLVGTQIAGFLTHRLNSILLLVPVTANTSFQSLGFGKMRIGRLFLHTEVWHFTTRLN